MRRRPVTIGKAHASLAGIEVLDGVSEGEEVVTAGVRRLTDGMAVRVLAAGGESAA